MSFNKLFYQNFHSINIFCRHETSWQGL